MDDREDEIYISEIPSKSSMKIARDFLRLIASDTEDPAEFALIVTSENGKREELALSTVAQRAIIDMFRLIADGKRFQINSVEIELTVEQAAEMLGVSKPLMEKLLNEGRIPFIETEGQRTLQKTAILAYREERRLRRSEGMKRLIEMDAKLLDIEDENFKKSPSSDSNDG
ncbi:helix-turn-helix domain-containing protein [uncultured Cohaesibacter sp.]|uniref:helix-turn-helix domain-containing protein n=1 Tax=uncultured Cohaesibacter sp. TaxID=1002546 RepID=UPI0029C889BF|nr:helix-turn-helix domain-containing protein [uncultured Cohaesibacter sp.]